MQWLTDTAREDIAWDQVLAHPWHHFGPDEAQDAYRALRMPQCPDLVVRALETTDRIRGIGEPTVPPAAPALANAIFAATGRRLRDLPLSDAIRFA